MKCGICLPSVEKQGFSCRFLTLLGGIIILYLVAAAIVNPWGEFGFHIFPSLVLDSRSTKIRLFVPFNRAEPVEGLIVGSSRSMLIAPTELQHLTNKRFFNFSVDNARAEDYLAIYRWVQSHNGHLGALLLGLDIESLHNDDCFDERLIRNIALMRALPNQNGGSLLEGTRQVCNRLNRLLNVTYAEDMAWSLGNTFRPSQVQSDVDPDGLWHFLKFEREVASGTFDLPKHLAFSREEYERRFRGMTALSAKRRGYLEDLLMAARHDGVKVILWITPVHPDLAQHLGRETQYKRLLEETRAYVLNLEKRYGIKTLDMSEMGLFGGTPGDWYDGAHVNPNGASLITQRVAGCLENHGL